MEEIIRMDLRELESQDVNSTRVVQERDQRWAFVNTVKNFRVS
jgi:hypothetical protein